MLLFFLLTGSLMGFCWAEHETLCTPGACFTLHRDNVSFAQANGNCYDRGGYLMTVRDQGEEDVLRLLASQVHWPPQDRRGLAFYIGLRLRKGECVHPEETLKGFKWVSEGEDSGYSNWETEHPVPTCSERCVRVRYTLSTQLKWVSGPCRHKSYYACKFYFRGMCEALTLLGRGRLTYTAAFSREPLRGKMKSLPFGTLATITCSDGQHRESWCLESGGGEFGWSDPGPFCEARDESCDVGNGGCEHLCHQDADGIRCSCEEGHDLDEDELSCTAREPCATKPCEHRCVADGSEYSCECLDGFRLDGNGRNCSDVDECQRAACGSHVCVNMQGGYKCECNGGYRMVEGECRDVDECERSECEHGCVNSPGSFSCRCDQGFALSEDGRLCADVDECLHNPCDSKCVNTVGGFSCSCPLGFHLDLDGLTCAPDAEVSSTQNPTEDDEQESTTETSSELQQASAHTEAPLPHLVNATQGGPQSSGEGSGGNDTSPATSFTKMANSKVLICVLGSVLPLLFLISVTLAIAVYRCSRSRKEAKKKTTTDGYCWVSSGLDPRLEKLYESILTDDL